LHKTPYFQHYDGAVVSRQDNSWLNSAAYR